LTLGGFGRRGDVVVVVVVEWVVFVWLKEISINKVT
jgi:hypothetical protein